MIATFSDWYGHVLIRTVTECREVLKYPGKEDRDKWVLETLLFGVHEELPNAIHGSYEPLWIFRNEKGGYLKPIWKAVDFLVYSVLYGPKRSIADRVAEDQKAFADEVMYFKELMDDRAPYIATMLKRGSAIVVPSNYDKGE
jgi:hypothetical protein